MSAKLTLENVCKSTDELRYYLLENYRAFIGVWLRKTVTQSILKILCETLFHTPFPLYFG